MRGNSVLPQVRVQDEGGTHRYPVAAGAVIVGRDPSSDIMLLSGRVSRRHAVLNWDGTDLAVTDLGSMNGTVVNGAPVAGRTLLADGDSLVVGDVELVIELDDGETTVIPRVEAIRPDVPTAAPPSPSDLRPPPQPAGGGLATPPTVASTSGTAGRRRTGRTLFVSYASEDRTQAQRIVEGLRQRGWEVSIDRDFLRPGMTWTQEIADRISACSAVLVVVTPAAAGSPWVSKELVAAVNADRPILPVVIDSSFVAEAQRRFALIADSHWLVLEGEQLFDPLRIGELSDHLDAIRSGARPRRRSSARLRIGTAILWLGALGTVAVLVWFGVGMARVAGQLLDVVDAGTSADAFDSTAVDAAFRDYFGSLVSLFVAIPLLVTSIVLALSGWGMRRRERKRLLAGRSDRR